MCDAAQGHANMADAQTQAQVQFSKYTPRTTAQGAEDEVPRERERERDVCQLGHSIIAVDSIPTSGGCGANPSVGKK